ncbi:MAG: S41 family peptidase [Flavobacteriales bacterium]|jgi:carboxyl-terminal processing protease|nr:S41 family peptidase [Flavobacteriales bacterium]
MTTPLGRSFRIAAAALLLSSPCSPSAAQTHDPTGAVKLEALLGHLDRMYVDSVPKAELVDAAIVRILEELDPHSIYIPKEDLEQVNEPLKGNFEGVGIQFNLVRDTIYVVDAIAGGPSERLGIRAGDRVLEIDGENAAGVGFKNNDVMKRLRGRKGTKVNVSILRRGVADPLAFTITRDKIPIHSVEAGYMATPTVGYIKVSRFSATTVKEFRSKLEELKAEGMRDLVLDLQGNGGGYLRTAIAMADEFLPAEKLIVYTEGRTSPREDTYATGNGLFERGRVVVLIDEGSASASEIVSGAVQDHDRGLVIGRRSFGKGLVQRPVMLPDGSAVRLTVSRYYTPSGRSIQKSYEDGVDAYKREKSARMASGELMHADSVHAADTTRYYTLTNRRVVHGGGGIMPDIFVPIDTALSSAYFGKLVRRGVLNTFTLGHVERHRSELTALYPNPAAFIDGFRMDEGMFATLVQEAAEQDIPLEEDGLERSRELIALRVKALVARDLWDTSAYWQVVNADNPVDQSYQRAIDALSDNTFQKLGMARH